MLKSKSSKKKLCLAESVMVGNDIRLHLSTSWLRYRYNQPTTAVSADYWRSLQNNIKSIGILFHGFMGISIEVEIGVSLLEQIIHYSPLLNFAHFLLLSSFNGNCKNTKALSSIWLLQIVKYIQNLKYGPTIILDFDLVLFQIGWYRYYNCILTGHFCGMINAGAC